MTMTTEAELDLSLASVPLDLSIEELLDLAVPAMPAHDDFAFTLFHESDGEDSPRSVETDMDTTKLLLALEDNSTESEHDVEMATSSSDPSCESVTFVEKTYYMVNTCASRLVCWNATGTGFFILDTHTFAREVLPEYFKHRNMNAFVSELTLHGFHKTIRRHKTSAIECLEFRHPHFVRGDVTQLTKIQRRVCSSAPSVSSSTSVLDEALASDDDDDDDEFNSDGEDVVEHMGDLKCELSKLKGEVQQTQSLFDKLIVTLMQQNAADSSFVMPVPPFQGVFHHPPFPVFGVPAFPAGMPPACVVPMTSVVGAVPTSSSSVDLGGADSDEFFADLFPSIE
jgi:hypothetical protein